MKENVNKFSNVLLTGLSVFALLALVGTAAYAIINVNSDLVNINATLSISERPIFTATPTDDISMNISGIGGTAVSSYVVTSSSSNINISLSSSYSVNTKCNYDIVWNWDIHAETYSKPSETEYTISGSAENDAFSEVQLNSYANLTNGRQVLYSSNIIASGSEISTQNWQFTSKFYKTLADQSSKMNKTYNGHISIDNVVCSKSDAS